MKKYQKPTDSCVTEIRLLKKTRFFLKITIYSYVLEECFFSRHFSCIRSFWKPLRFKILKQKNALQFWAKTVSWISSFNYCKWHSQGLALHVSTYLTNKLGTLILLLHLKFSIILKKKTISNQRTYVHDQNGIGLWGVGRKRPENYYKGFHQKVLSHHNSKTIDGRLTKFDMFRQDSTVQICCKSQVSAWIRST